MAAQMLIALLPLISGTYSATSAFIAAHGYIAIIFLMSLESASVPIPSEILLPLVGHFVAEGLLNGYIAFAASLIGTIIGISVDYFIAYFLEKGVVYKNMRLFHIKRENLESFDRWFARNGSFAVSVGRLIPLVRGLISLPAGFAKMPLKKFYLYSMAGAVVWNAALIIFGYYALSTSNAQLLLISIAALAIVLYAVYRVSFGRIRRSR